MLDPRTSQRCSSAALLLALALLATPSWAIEGDTDAPAGVETEDRVSEGFEGEDELPAFRNPYAAPADLKDRWLPSFSIGADVYEERGAGTLNQTDLAESGVGGTIEGFDRRNVMALRFIFELASPAFEPGELDLGLFTVEPSLRLFGYAGTQIHPSKVLQAESAGSLATVGALETQVVNYLSARVRNPARPPNDPEDFLSQGSEYIGESTNESWILGFGTSYRHEYDSFDVRLRGSVEYFGQKIRGHVKSVTVIKPSDDVFDVIGVDLAQTQTYHSLGPSFELETVVKRSGRIGVGFYAQVRYLWSVGDRNASFSDDVGLVDITYRRPGASLRGGAGIRISWQDL